MIVRLSFGRTISLLQGAGQLWAFRHSGSGADNVMNQLGWSPVLMFSLLFQLDVKLVDQQIYHFSLFFFDCKMFSLEGMNRGQKRTILQEIICFRRWIGQYRSLEDFILVHESIGLTAVQDSFD
jgi:hypothetical protein